MAVAAAAVTATAVGYALRPIADSPKQESRAAEDREEIRALATERTRTYRNADGSFSMIIAAAPINVRGDGGSWEPARLQLEASGVTGAAWRASTGAYEALFKPLLAADYASVGVPGARFAVALEGSNPASIADVRGGTITYRSAVPNADLEYVVLPTQLKETIVLRTREAPSSYAFFLRPASDSALVPQAHADGSWTFRPVTDDEIAFRLAAPTVVDAAAVSPPAADAASLAVSAVDGGFRTVVRVSERWLNDPERVFPVRLDPTIELSPPLRMRASARTARPVRRSQTTTASGSAGTEPIPGAVPFASI